MKFFKWSDSDLSILRKYYGELKNSEIQHFLSKKYSENAIRGMALNIGLGQFQRWTKEEEELLQVIYSTKPMCEVMTMLPNRTAVAIIQKAREFNLYSYFNVNKLYTNQEVQYLIDNHATKTVGEMARNLNRSELGVELKLRKLGLNGSANGLNVYIRSKLGYWRETAINELGQKCCLTGKTDNLVIHHCRSFNLLVQEAAKSLNFQFKDYYEDYSKEELHSISEKVFDLQEQYKEYVCISKDIHRVFHKEYGYGNNTIEQWNDIVEKYKSGYYTNL